ncbi:hypothetical protein EGJ44_07280, partial [Ectopseudomonas oleovorans]
PIPSPLGAGSTWQAKQISQGNSRDLSAYACRIYVVAFRASIGLWQSLLPHPATPPLSASCSSGQHFASGFLQIRSRPRHPCLWLTLPLAGCVEDFHLQVVQSTTTVNRTAPVTALRAMPGAQRKRRASSAASVIRRSIQIEKDDPQPQVVVALGFLITKREPSSPS